MILAASTLHAILPLLKVSTAKRCVVGVFGSAVVGVVLFGRRHQGSCMCPDVPSPSLVHWLNPVQSIEISQLKDKVGSLEKALLANALQALDCSSDSLSLSVAQSEVERLRVAMEILKVQRQEGRTGLSTERRAEQDGHQPENNDTVPCPAPASDPPVDLDGGSSNAEALVKRSETRVKALEETLAVFHRKASGE